MEPALTAQRLHFACTGCGKCCTSPPVMAVTEALALYRDFALVLKLGGPIADANLPDSNPIVQTYIAQRAHLKAHGAESFALRVDAQRQWETTLIAAALPLRAGADDPCPALTSEGLCGIYERRPQRCRVVPFDHWLPEAMAVQAGANRLQEALARDWACDVSADAPVVAEGGRLTEGPYRAAYEQGLAEMRRADPVMALLAHTFHAQLQAQPQMVPQVVEALIRRETLDFSFPAVLEALHNLHRDKDTPRDEHTAMLEDLPPLREFMRVQIELMESLVARNVARRRPQDRPITERLRGLVVEYRRGLESLK
jgi:Fe-S-cluster containining protein